MKPMLFESEAARVARETWWESLPTNAKRTTVRRAEKKQARVSFKAIDKAHAYICPKCFAAYPTAEARNFCKTGHLRMKYLTEE